MTLARELHVSEGRLRRRLQEELAPKRVEEIIRDLRESPCDEYDILLTDEKRAELREKYRRKGML